MPPGSASRRALDFGQHVPGRGKGPPDHRYTATCGAGGSRLQVPLTCRSQTLATRPGSRKWGLTPSSPGPWGALGVLDHRGNAGCHTSGTRHGRGQTLVPAPSQVHGPHPGLTLTWAWGPRATLPTHSSGVPGPRPRSWFSADAPGRQQQARTGTAGGLHGLGGPGEGPPDPVRPQRHSWKQDLGAAPLPAWTQGPGRPVPGAQPTPPAPSGPVDAPRSQQSLSRPSPRCPNQPRQGFGITGKVTISQKAVSQSQEGKPPLPLPPGHPTEAHMQGLRHPRTPLTALSDPDVLVGRCPEFTPSALGWRSRGGGGEPRSRKQ